MSNTAALREALNRLVPLVGNYWERPVASYAAAVYDGFELSKHFVRQDAFKRFCTLLCRKAGRLGYDADQIAQMLDQLRNRPIIQTGPHCHLVIEPDAFFTHLFCISGLKAHAQRWYVNYSVSTVKFTEKSKKGPGWLRLDGQNVNVFGLSRSKMDSLSICSRQMQLRFAMVPEPPDASTPLRDELLRVLPDDDFSSAAEAIKTANRILWHKHFGTRSNFLQLDESDIAELVSDHLDDEVSWLSRHFIEKPETIESFIRAVREIDRGPWAGWFRFNTDFFWLVHHGRLRPLELENGVLRNSSRTYRVQFNSAALARALERGEIVPGLFLVFLVIAVLPGLRVLGGSRQIIYYPLMRRALLMALESSSLPADRELAAAIREDEIPSVWGHRTIAPTTTETWHLLARSAGSVASLSNDLASLTLRQTASDLPAFSTDELWLKCCARLER
ncbi:hypothetical protein [Brucella intermedia]|uniref:hypothetical protein n=1 Tax=Brucella intermedia TaxID=94625 RepID=UPI00124E8AB0|nr:hypothetical protein [Brucella intermedia]KAB2723394.1 hypothetical protein F9L02_22145 [Brucella intermedia]